jgi:hypothetical protein
MNRAKARRPTPVIRTTPRALAVAAAVGGGMNTSKGTGTVQAVIQADVVYAKVGGTALRLDLSTPSGATLGTRRR